MVGSHMLGGELLHRRGVVFKHLTARGVSEGRAEAGNASPALTSCRTPLRGRAPRRRTAAPAGRIAIFRRPRARAGAIWCIGLNGPPEPLRGLNPAESAGNEPNSRLTFAARFRADLQA